MDDKRELTEVEKVINLISGTVFKRRDGGVFLKLMNPEIPKLAKLSDYPVLAADTGNGHLEKIEPYELVEFIGNCYDLILGGQQWMIKKN